MVIYNCKDMIDEQLTLEYKSGNARELKVTHRNYYLCLSKLEFSLFALAAASPPRCTNGVFPYRPGGKPTEWYAGNPTP